MNEKYVHHNKCEGGKATVETDGKTYCCGRVDAKYEGYVYLNECIKCPRFLYKDEAVEHE
jgi:hypothetical protein